MLAFSNLIPIGRELVTLLLDSCHHSELAASEERFPNRLGGCRFSFLAGASSGRRWARCTLFCARGTCDSSTQVRRRPLRAGAVNLPASYSNADRVKRDHRGSKKTHVQDVARRCNYCRDNEYREHRISQIPPHPASRNHPHQSEKKHKNRHFENQAKTDDDR